MLNQLTREIGAKFWLVEGVYRPALPGVMQDEVIQAYGTIFDFNKMTKTLKEFSSKEGIEFLSLPEIVKEQNIPASTLMHQEDTMHFDHNGIHLYATNVVSKLRSLGLGT